MTDSARDLLERVLAARVLQSLDEGHEDPAAVERAWRDEIGRRVREVREGRVKPIPTDEVFARARAMLSERRRRA